MAPFNGTRRDEGTRPVPARDRPLHDGPLVYVITNPPLYITEEQLAEGSDTIDKALTAADRFVTGYPQAVATETGPKRLAGKVVVITGATSASGGRAPSGSPRRAPRSSPGRGARPRARRSSTRSSAPAARPSSWRAT